LSGFIALLAPEGQRIAAEIVDRMLPVLAIRGPDGARTWIDGRVAMSHAELAVAPGACLPPQPHSDEAGHVRVVLDGRFDNRDELAAAFEPAGLPLRDGSDSELLLRAYQLWGEGCAQRLLGDFAFAIWDGRRRALVAARDVLGIRPLYWSTRAGAVAVASEIAPLCRHPFVSREPNDAFLAEVLNGGIVHRTDTVWRDVSRLAAGHLLIAEDGRVRTRRYWAPDPALQVRYRSDEEYAEHLAELMRRAVERRMRDRAAVGVMLSGGVDSSSLVGAIHALQVAGRSNPLPTFSIVAPGEPWDETPYVDAVAAMWPIVSHRRGASEGTPEYYAAEAVKYRDLPPYPNGVMANAIFGAARSEYGVRVLLTGLWSDEWLGPSGMHGADLLRSRHFMQLWRHYRSQPPSRRSPASMFRSSVWPNVPLRARETVKRMLGRDGVSPWMNRSYAAAVNLADRLQPQPPFVRFPTLAQTTTWNAAVGGSSQHAVEAENRATAAFGLETRHPFADRGILEFGLAIPEAQRWREPNHKPALREAARAWVPDFVRRRTIAAGASSVLLRTVERHVSSGLWQNAVTARRGWVDLPGLRGAFDEMIARYRTGDEGYERLVFPLWMACAAEIFARHVLDEPT
jgi:asparagine synthase (glutamine-hydrolysing)